MPIHRKLAVVAIALFLVSMSSQAGLRFGSTASTAQAEPVPGPGFVDGASIEVEFDDGFTEMAVRLVIEGGDNVVAAHFHCAAAGANGPVAFGLFGPGPLVFDGSEAAGILTNDDSNDADCEATIGRPVTNLVSLALAMRDGLIYLNVHTTDNPPGEVRGQMLEGGESVDPGNGGDDDDDDDDDDGSMARHRVFRLSLNEVKPLR